MKREDWTMREWRDYYESLQKKAYMNYQATGESRYDREELKYSKIVDAFNGYLEHKDERDNERHRRVHNINAYVERNVNKDYYNRNEVLKLIMDISTF